MTNSGNNSNAMLKRMVFAALFTALTCVSTMAIRIPTPGTSGYVHLGDALVILCAAFLDPAYAFLAAGLGSAMADLLGGYFIYVPITFVIKGLIALLGSLVMHSKSSFNIKPTVKVIICGVIDIVLVAGGYFVCESFLYGAAASLLSVPANCIQGVSGLLIAAVAYPVLRAPLHLVYQEGK